MLLGAGAVVDDALRSEASDVSSGVAALLSELRESAGGVEISFCSEMVSACSDNEVGTVVEWADEALIAGLPQRAAISEPLR